MGFYQIDRLSQESKIACESIINIVAALRAMGHSPRDIHFDAVASQEDDGTYIHENTVTYEVVIDPKDDEAPVIDEIYFSVSVYIDDETGDACPFFNVVHDDEGRRHEIDCGTEGSVIRVVDKFMRLKNPQSIEEEPARWLQIKKIR